MYLLNMTEDMYTRYMSSLSDARFKGYTSHWVVLWSATLYKSSHTISELRFDPTKSTHTYKVVINEDASMFDQVSIELRLICVWC